METTRKPSETKIRKEKKDESKRPQNEKLKKSVNPLSTPREYISKTSASDIYTQNKASVKAPKKVPGISSTRNISPMKGLLRSSASSISQVSRTVERPPKKLEAKPLSRNEAIHSAKTETKPPLKKRELFTNVTVNSPVVKRKLDLNSERVKKEAQKLSQSKEVGKKSKEVGEARISKEVDIPENYERQRTKTRTLDESEVKVLDKVDNNAGMLNLSKKLAAKPKAFYVGLDEDKSRELANKEISDEEVSYEDDFESYESDFDSYHSDIESNGSEANGNRSDASKNGSDASENGSDASESRRERNEMASTESSLKEKDEEKMLDSGNFDLRDQRSGRSKPAVMAFILEDTESDKKIQDDLPEDDKKVSLDEGFQDMSTASIRTEERPLFIDFTKSKQNKLKRKINERLKQRAKDLQGMITLHEMPYSLFEMQPISYDLFMATFGRSNYTQSGVQTFDDGITEEVQTDEVITTQKWTQYPVKFSNFNISLNACKKARKYSESTEDYLAKFTFLINEKCDDQVIKEIETDENYSENPLRILLEQKDGAGGDEMLPFEIYKSKLKSNDYNVGKLSKFLKKNESKVTRILTANTGNTVTYFEKTSKLPFSKGHISLIPKILNENYSFLNSSKITKVFFSDTKSNLILTVHKNVQSVGKKSLICLWDLSVARVPMKVLLTIDDVTVGRFRGNTDGVFVAALEDGSIHLWDLAEEPFWRDSVATENKSPEIEEIKNDRLTQTERDREWNLKNSKVGLQQTCIPFALHSCSYTSSAFNMSENSSDRIVGLEFMNNQIISLQRIGIITIWNIIQEKSKISKDVGKAYWSKMKLEKNQTINILDYIDTTIKEKNNFNLNSAKRRITIKKQEKHSKKEPARPASSKSSIDQFDIDRPYSAASMRKKVLPVEMILPKSWENGIVCNDLKIVNVDGVNSFLVGKNCGEVLVCNRCLGIVRIERFSVATDTSSITSLDVSSEGIPYFIAATDTGAINVCSLRDRRVLLTLDCRNVPSSPDVDKCQSDHKGRFISSVAKCITKNAINRLEIKSVHWSCTNRCCVYALLQNGTLVSFDLTHSDINARSASVHAASQCTHSVHTLALITPEGEVQIHRLTDEQRSKEYLHLFNKYVALL